MKSDAELAEIVLAVARLHSPKAVGELMYMHGATVGYHINKRPFFTATGGTKKRRYTLTPYGLEFVRPYMVGGGE